MPDLGFPIRRSPDRRVLASPRSVSPLAASFFACWHQGIHTPALSSLTIKSTLRFAVYFFYYYSNLLTLLTYFLTYLLHLL